MTLKLFLILVIPIGLKPSPQMNKLVVSFPNHEEKFHLFPYESALQNNQYWWSQISTNSLSKNWSHGLHMHMVKLECSACKKRVMLHVACAKNSSHVLQMLPLECPRVLCPSVSSTFGVRSSVSLSLHVRKGKCPMSPDHKVEIHLPKIRLMDSKCFNSNNPGSCGPLFHPLLGSAVACPFLCIQEKGNLLCRLFIKWKFTFQELVSWTPNVPTRMPQGLAALCFIHFWGPL